MSTDFNADHIKVSLPLRDVLALYDMVKDYPILLQRFYMFESELEGLRAMDSKLMIALGDIRREIRG